MLFAQFLLTQFFGVAAAWSLSRVLLPKSSSLEAAAAMLASFAVIAILILQFLGLVGELNSLALAATTSLVAIALFPLQIWRRRQTSSERASAPAHPAVVEVNGSGQDRAILGAALGVLLLFCALAFWAQMVSPMSLHWDDFSYHATMPGHWLQEGSLGLYPYNYHAFFPANAELFTLWFVLPTRIASFHAIAGLFWLGMTAFSAASLVRQLGAGLVPSVATATLVLSSWPHLDQAKGYSATDLATAALTCLAAYFSLHVGGGGSAKPRWGAVIYAGLLMGLAVGAKVTVAPIAVLVLGFVLWKLRATHSSARVLLSFGGLALIGGGFWYIRNWSITGNPFFPAATLGFKGPLDAETRWATSLVASLMGLEKHEWLPALRKLLDWPLPLSALAALGYVLVLTKPLSWRRKRGSPAADAALLLIGLIGIVLLTTIALGPFSGTVNQEHAPLRVRLRFFVGVTSLGLVLFFALADRLPRFRKWIALPALFVAAYTLNDHWYWALIAAAVGAGASFLVPFLEEVTLSHRVKVSVGFAVPILVIVGLYSSAKVREDADQEWLRKTRPHWTLFDTLPVGSRVTWLDGHGRYFGAFGRRFQFTPVAIGPEGKPYQHLSATWRSKPKTWWWSKQFPTLYEQGLTKNLMDQNIKGVLVRQERSKKWGREYEILMASPHAHFLGKVRSYAAFELDSNEALVAPPASTRRALP